MIAPSIRFSLPLLIVIAARGTLAGDPPRTGPVNRATSFRPGEAHASEPDTTARQSHAQSNGSSPRALRAASSPPQTPADRPSLALQREQRPSSEPTSGSDRIRKPNVPRKLPRKDPAPRRSAGGSVGGQIMTVAGSLTFVLGLFCALAWLGRRVWPSNSIPLLPQGVLEVLGRSLLAGRQHLYLVRLGNKLLLVCVTAAGAQTLAEITEPMEVDRIAGLCGQNESGNITATFRQVLSQLGRTSHGRQPLAGQYRHRTASTA